MGGQAGSEQEYAVGRSKRKEKSFATAGNRHRVEITWKLGKLVYRTNVCFYEPSEQTRL
jgi:hypothetical protein